MESISNNSEGDHSPAAMDGDERKRKRTRSDASASSIAHWKTEIENRRYSSKLLDALRRVRSSPADPRGRLLREAADRALAVAARGRTRWSRAILSAQVSNLKSSRRRRAAVEPALSGRPKRTGNAAANAGVYKKKKKKIPIVERKAKQLARLVPGCRKLLFPKLLEEATDYIAALQMQVRALNMLKQIFSSAGDHAADRLASSESP